MTNTGRLMTVVLSGVLAVLVPGRTEAQTVAVSATGAEATVVLHVVNLAAISGEVLNKVKDHVAGTYASIGVRTVWVESEQAVGKHVDNGLHLTVMLLPRETAGRKMSAEDVSIDTLGRARPRIGRAYIFCDRVTSMPGKFLRSGSARSLLTKLAISCCPGRAIPAVASCARGWTRSTPLTFRVSISRRPAPFA